MKESLRIRTVMGILIVIVAVALIATIIIASLKDGW